MSQPNTGTKINNSKTMSNRKAHLIRQTSKKSALIRRFTVGVLTFLMGFAIPAFAARDSVTVESIPLAAAGDTVQVPVYVRDVSGTILGGDGGIGRTIQDVSVVIQVSPPAAVTSVTFQKAGVLVGPSPVFEQSVSSGDERGAVITFSESGDPITLILDSAAPGDLVAQLEVEIAPGFLQGTIILALVASKTALGNQSGTLAEKPVEGQLTLVGGSIYVDQALFLDGFESGTTNAWSNTVP